MARFFLVSFFQSRPLLRQGVYRISCKVYPKSAYHFSSVISPSLVQTIIISHLDYFKIFLKFLLYFYSQWFNVIMTADFLKHKVYHIIHLLKTMQFSHAFRIKLCLPISAFKHTYGVHVEFHDYFFTFLFSLKCSHHSGFLSFLEHKYFFCILVTFLFLQWPPLFSPIVYSLNIYVSV